MKAIIKKISIVAAALLPLAVMAQQPTISNWRAYDQSGINVFETGKADSVKFDGLKVRWGAGFTQQFQGLKHETQPTITQVIQLLLLVLINYIQYNQGL
jgi:hypothetical protein